ncbi:hypothetical protein MtrunA17_Chr2g0302331 [Medicago truncatula]|uniref:Uncharacterized protein n=1 Tax=Medicago truncatula TaxID=3880 RepID=A0A396J6I2_MEDTR|nr:hypothetical protein MtrunA17_Chr2g0302331 [Medicago truncatula]
MHLIHNFSLKTYYFKCLKNVLEVHINISHKINEKMDGVIDEWTKTS